MREFFRNFDFSILIAAILLTILGLTTVWSVSSRFFPQQLIYVLIGFFVFFLFSQIDYRIYQSLSWLIYFLGILSLLFTLIIGQVTRGSVRWIEIGVFRLQTSELFKPFLILFISSFLSNEKLKYMRPMIIFFFLIPSFLVFKQPDLGNVLIYLSIFLGIMFISGINFWHNLAFPLLLFLGAPIIWQLLKPYQKERILTFLNPTADPLDRGYNILQSIIAIGSGKIFGRGLGRGTQSHLQFLPEFHTDFIFASLAEELGFLGTFLILGIYGFLLLRILKISENTKDKYSKIVSMGIFVMLLSQIFINIGMNIGVLPIAGVTLPLISYGGSSILATMISLGIMENLAKNRGKEGTLEIK